MCLKPTGILRFGASVTQQQFLNGGFRGAAFAGTGEHQHQVFHCGGEPRLQEQVAQGGGGAFMHRSIAFAVACEFGFKLPELLVGQQVALQDGQAVICQCGGEHGKTEQDDGEVFHGKLPP